MLPEPLHIQQWEQWQKERLKPFHDKGNLQFCPEKSLLANVLPIQYLRKKNIQQMDLFFDNQSLELANELKTALISRNIRTASQKLQDLYSVDPEHETFEPAKKLLDALVNALEEENVNPKNEMEYLLTELKPLAEKTLAGQDRDYMSIFWRRLASTIDDSSYCENEKDAMQSQTLPLHSSFCYQQIPDWQAVIDSSKDAQVKKYPKLFARYALALQKSGQRESYMQTVCHFFWQYFPLYTEHYFQQTDNNPATFDTTLKKLWHDFQDQELDDVWGIQHFPAWMLIEDPGLSHQITSNEYTPEEFKLLHQLILTEIKEKKQSIVLRKQLQVVHSGLLDAYLKNRE